MPLGGRSHSLTAPEVLYLGSVNGYILSVGEISIRRHLSSLSEWAGSLLEESRPFLRAVSHKAKRPNEVYSKLEFAVIGYLLVGRLNYTTRFVGERDIVAGELDYSQRPFLAGQFSPAALRVERRERPCF